MTTFPIRPVLLAAGAAWLLNGCGMISSWFPDKQKQYKYSTEIPPLEIPPDLTATTIEGVSARSSYSAASGAGGEETPATPVRESSAAAAEGGGSGAGPTLAQSTDNVPLIEIEAPFDLAWLEVSKALGRMEVEVSDQNRGDGLFYVYYGSGDKPKEDQGFFGDMAELFSGGPNRAKEYRVKVESRGKVCVVYVLDSENKPQLEGPGLELLKRLNATLSSAPAAPEKPAS